MACSGRQGVGRGHFSRPGLAPRAVIVNVEPGVLVVDLRRALAPRRAAEEDDAPLDRRGRVEGAAGGTGRALAVGHLPPGPAGEVEHVRVAQPARVRTAFLSYVDVGKCVHVEGGGLGAAHMELSCPWPPKTTSLLLLCLPSSVVV